jgi:hypothetical protein
MVVIPAKAGIHVIDLQILWSPQQVGSRWIPAFAGMTKVPLSRG